MNRILLFIACIMAIAFPIRGQFKVNFDHFGMYANSLEFGVALRNYMGTEKFNSFLKDGISIWMNLALDVHGTVHGMELFFFKNDKAKMRPDSTIKILNKEDFERFLIDHKYSFSMTSRTEFESVEQNISNDMLFRFLPYSYTQILFPLETVALSLGGYDRRWNTYNIFNSSNVLPGRPYSGVDDYVIDLISKVSNIDSLYNSVIGFMCVYDYMGDYAMKILTKNEQFRKSESISFKLRLNKNGTPEDVLAINNNHFVPKITSAEENIFKSRLMHYFKNHHIKFRFDGMNNINNEIEVLFPGDLYNIWYDSPGKKSFCEIAFQVYEYFHRLDKN